MSQLQPDLALLPTNLVMRVISVTARVCTQQPSRQFLNQVKAKRLVSQKYLLVHQKKAFVADLGLASLTR